MIYFNLQDIPLNEKQLQEDIKMKKEKSTIETLKVIFVVIGAVVSLAALAAVVYTIFKEDFICQQLCTQYSKSTSR